MNILLLDNNPLVQELVKSQAGSVEMKVAETAQQAELFLLSAPPGLIIIGAELSPAVIQFIITCKQQHAPIILVTKQTLENEPQLSDITKVASLTALVTAIQHNIPAYSEFSTEFNPVCLSGKQAQVLHKLVRVFNHDLNNKMTVVCNSANFAVKNPNLAVQMVGLIDSSVGKNVVTDKAKQLLADITAILQPKPAS